MLALPCPAVNTVWIEVAKALRARPPLGQRSPPSRRRPQREGGARKACSLLIWWPLAGAASVPWAGTVAAARRGYLGPVRCGQKHRGATPAAQPPAGGGGRSSWEGEAAKACRAGGAPVGPEESTAQVGSGPGLSPQQRTGRRPPPP